MKHLRLALAAFVLLVAFPLMLLSFRHRERLDAVAREAERAEAAGQHRLAASAWERGARLGDRFADPLLAILSGFGISSPTRSGMLLCASRAHARSALASLERMRENPSLLEDARRALARLVEEFGGSDLAREEGERLARLERIQRAQTLHLESRHAEAVAILRALRVPEGEAEARERFLRARLLALCRLSLYREGRRVADLSAARSAFEYCFTIDPADAILAEGWRDVETLLLERMAERFPWKGQGADAPEVRFRRGTPRSPRTRE